MAADPVALAPDPQVAQHVDDFLAAQLSPRTRETYAVDLALYLTWLRERGVHPRDATRPDVDRYRNWLAEPIDPDGRMAANGRPRYTPSSVARKLSAVRAFYGYLAERRVVPGSPAVGVRGPRVRREPRGVLDGGERHVAVQEQREEGVAQLVRVHAGHLIVTVADQPGPLGELGEQARVRLAVVGR